jgi:hypothetical protein
MSGNPTRMRLGRPRAFDRVLSAARTAALSAGPRPLPETCRWAPAPPSVQAQTMQLGRPRDQQARPDHLGNVRRNEMPESAGHQAGALNRLVSTRGYSESIETAAELGVRHLPRVEAHPVNGRNPDFSPCSREPVHPGTPNSAAVPHGLGQLIDSSCFSDRHFRHGGYNKA